jgi:hypothetical protein
MANRYVGPIVTGLERKFQIIEEGFGCAVSNGHVPGTMLSRALMPEDQGGGVGWCLSIGRMQMPKCHFYARTINGCFQKARNAIAKGKTTPPTIAIVS